MSQKNSSTKDFRDHVSTVDATGKRIWVFSKKPSGVFYRWRSRLSYIQLLFLFFTPFIHIGGKPLILLDVMERRFILFGKTFWPQDFFILGVGMILIILLIFLISAVYGRIFCGWLCPQTIFLEMLFRKIEYWIDGDPIQQRKLLKPENKKLWLKKRIFKHSVFLVLSFLMGNVFLAYFIGREKLWEIITDPPSEHGLGLSLMIIFTLAFYWLYSYFREQFCSFLCPYARLQSVLLDDNSINVAYDHVRGEPHSEGGDCINCKLCEHVCPAGINIRNGTPQLECIQCTACIDACDSIMTKIKKPKGLIRYASPNMIEQKKSFEWTGRIISYSLLVFLLCGALGFLIYSRKDVETKLFRRRGAVPQLHEGIVTNIYTAKVQNKSSKGIVLELKAKDSRLRVPGGKREVAPESKQEVIFFIDLPFKESLKNSHQKMEVDIYIDAKYTETLETTFLY